MEKFKFSLEKTVLASESVPVTVLAEDKEQARAILASYMYNRDANKLEENSDFIKFGESELNTTGVYDAYMVENDFRDRCVGMIGITYCERSEDPGMKPKSYESEGTFTVAWKEIEDIMGEDN